MFSFVVLSPHFYSCSSQKSHLICHQYQCVPWPLSVTLLILVLTVYSAQLYDLRTAFCPHSVFMYFVWISEQTMFLYTALTDWFIYFR